MKKHIEGKWRSFTSSRKENSVILKLRSVLKGRNRIDSARHKKSMENALKTRQKA